MGSWVEAEVAGAELGDARLKRRMCRLVGRLSENPGAGIPAACGGWAETLAAYRFLANRRTTAEKVLAPHAAATVARIRAQEVVLVVQDTTECDFTGKGDIAGVGPLNWKERQGLFCHVHLAVTPQRCCLGTGGAYLWARDPARAPYNAERKKKVLADKQSHRWVDGYRQACAVAAAAPDTTIISLADREGDVSEWYVAAAEAARRGHAAEWIVRSCQDRSLPQRRAGTVQGYEKRWEEVGRGPLQGRVSWRLPARPGRKARAVNQEIRSARVRLRPPYRAGAVLPEVEVNAVLAREVDPPAGEKPVTWLLLTSLPVGAFAEARQVVEYYLCRWQIEVFFKVFKQGCRIEALQLQTFDRLRTCLMLYLIVAWRTMWVTTAARTHGEEPCTILFADEEWQPLYRIVKKRPAPAPPPRLGEFVKLLAGLGGYLGRKGDGPPGPKAIWIGLQRMHCFTLAWDAFGGKPTLICV